MDEASCHASSKDMGTIPGLIHGDVSAVVPQGQVRQCAHGFSCTTSLLGVVVVVQLGAQMKLKLVSGVDMLEALLGALQACSSCQVLCEPGSGGKAGRH